MNRRQGHPAAGRCAQILVGLSAVALLAAACSSSSKSSGSAGSGSSPSVSSGAASAALGTPDKATGTPVNVGLISDGGSGAIGTAPLVEQGAKMVVAYANAYRGGLAGHPINLLICENQSTPVGGQNCANQLVQQHVVAVVLPFTGQGPTEVPTITKAGIPYITVSGASSQELTTPGSFALTGGFPAALGSFALQAKQKGFAKMALLVENVPAAIEGAQVFGGLVFKNAGIGFKVIPVAPGTPDMTPQLQAAVSFGASAIGMVGDVTFCSSFLKGYHTLGLTQPKYVLSTCQDKSIFSALGPELNGSYIATTSQASASDLALYAGITEKFAPSVSSDPNVSSNQASGATSVLALLNIMSGYSGDVTAATVLHQVETVKNVVLPLSGGITFTCDGSAIPLLKSVCSSSAAVGIVSGSGVITDIQTYNPTPLFS
jgi:branched-chain amino acid transport system substrate-binding protein